jgi:uncharacterized membrane protein
MPRASPATLGLQPATLAAHRARMDEGPARTRSNRAPYAMLALAVLGVADTLYVAHGSYTGQLLWCPIIEGCNTVAASPYSRVFGVPISYFGVIFYVFMFGLAALLAFDPQSRGLRVGAVLYGALGVLCSMYAMVLQLGAIRALCVYCLISAVTTLIFLIAAIWNLRATRGELGS